MSTTVLPTCPPAHSLNLTRLLHCSTHTHTHTHTHTLHITLLPCSIHTHTHTQPPSPVSPPPRTYADLLRSSASLGATLQASAPTDAAGDLNGARVAFLCGPGEAYVAAALATWRAGGVAVPLCTAHPAAELEYFLDDSAASVVMGSGKYKAVVEPLARARGVTFVDVDDHVGLPLAAADSAAAAFVPLEGLCAEQDLAERPAMVRVGTGWLGVTPVV